METEAANRILNTPGVVGFVQLSETGEVLEQQGQEAEALANVLMYFQQMASLIGTSFGLEDFSEAQIQGNSFTVLTLPYQSGAVGVVLNSRTRLSETVKLLRKTLSSSN